MKPETIIKIAIVMFIIATIMKVCSIAGVA